MENNKDIVIEEALKRYEERDGFDQFIAQHKDVQEEVQDIIAIQHQLALSASKVIAPRESFSRVLKKLNTEVATSPKRLPEVSPYFSMPLFRIGAPVLLLLIIVLGATRSGNQGQDVALLPEGSSATMDSMSMKSMITSESEVAPEAALMSMQAVEVIEPVQATGSVEDLIRTLEEDSKAELAAATLGDESFAIATNDATELDQFVNVYNENNI